jgi:hypothetical protein
MAGISNYKDIVWCTGRKGVLDTHGIKLSIIQIHEFLMQ